ncbi:glycosyltransferase family 87 protein [Streptomyces sp. NBC_00102]|uniref:glycosyltransferase family 87 protein n=1 Tax=Streptomyces sp. NBC_00102 TaxID=2975652 RepID=UPI002254CE6F|nr:glycosyltransferase family 87 protein [Streptomyces sp. NBC_00102]MCX5396542.1 DUF2029 domain-containing protein [Streptomyces sp. NBC_00102]
MTGRAEAAGVLAVWGATRAVLLLWVLKVVAAPGLDVTVDVSVIYRGWYEVLRTGVFPAGDVAWQYPPAAALPVLSPGLLPFLEYTTAFFVLVLVTDALVLALLLRAGSRPGARRAGAWVWVAGVPLLGPTVYARYDLMVTAVAVAALLAGVRRPRVLGALAAFGALLKVWPVLVLLGTAPGRVTRRAWSAAAVTAGVLAAGFWLAMPGAFAFLAYQRDRGTEIESLGGLALHLARQAGWPGRIELRYGSMEFLGPGLGPVSSLALWLGVAGFGWLVVWRLRARTFTAHTAADAAFTAVLLFTTVSRVISPQYLVWLVGLGAVCLVLPGSRMGRPVRLVLAACPVTFLEFPLGFVHVVASDATGVALLLVRNGLLVAATVIAATRLWRAARPVAPEAVVAKPLARTSVPQPSRSAR